MGMPTIDWPEDRLKERPSNRNFLDVKLKHIDDVLYRLRPYVDALMQLNGMHGRKDIREVVWFVLREFTGFFWDIPASRNYHHSGRWGLLYHSLEVALSRADEASRRVAVDAAGNPSAEASRKTRGEKVLIAWMAGLFHDSGKIFDMDIFYSAEDKDIHYHPLRGNVLGFKLKHSESGINIRWKNSRGMRHARRNLAMFMLLSPLSLLKQLTPEQLITLFDGLMEDGDAADQESVASDRYEQDREYVGQAVRMFARDNFRAKDKNGSVQIRIFALGQNTYALVVPVAIDALVRYIKNDLGSELYNRDRVVGHLIQEGLLYCSDKEEFAGNYFVQLPGFINQARVKFHLSFVHGNMLADVDVADLPVFKIADEPDIREKIRRVTGFDPPDEWFRDPSGKKDEKEKSSSSSEVQKNWGRKTSSSAPEKDKDTEEQKENVTKEKSEKSNNKAIFKKRGFGKAGPAFLHKDDLGK